MNSKVVVITGAAGRISYSLIPLVLNGSVLGSSTKIQLRLFDIPIMKDKLIGYKLEIEDSGFYLLEYVVATTDAAEAFAGADVVILLGGAPRGPGMERSEMIGINATGIAQQARDLEEFAKPDVKVLVVANPANTNCLVAINAVSKIPASSFSCLTRLDHERLRGMLAKRYNGTARDLVIWGNHSQTQVPYLLAATVDIDGTAVQVQNLDDSAEFTTAVTPQVQKRGAEIIKYQGASSAMSAAAAIAKHLQDWVGAGSPSNEMFSMGILSNGNPYGIPPGLVYSFPCRRNAAGDIEIVPDLPITSEVKAMLDKSTEELMAEKGEAEVIVGKIFIADSRL